MFDLNPEKLAILAIIALVVLGPERLPVFARKTGRVIAELRRMSGSFQDEMRGALAEPRQVLADAAEDMGLSSIPRVPSVRRAITNSVLGAIDASSQPAAAVPSPSASLGPSVQPDGLPPLPDDPTLN